MQFNNIVSARDNRFRSAFDGHYMVRNVGTAQLVQRYIQDFSLFAHLRTNQNQRTSTELPPLAYPAHTHGGYDFFSSQHFRVNQRIYSQFLEKLFIFRQKIFIVVDTRHCFFSSQVGGQHTGSHVATFVRCDCDKKVGFFDAYFFQSGDGRRRSGNSQQVKVGAKST